MSEYTAQEWQRDGTTVYALNIEGTNRFSAQVQGGWATDGRLRTDADELEANARLIAAAPELLEALRDLMPEFESRLGDFESPEWHDCWNKAVAAIAKATGEQP
jgi:hypothetical protein